MSLQNCSIASVPSPLGLALLVHLREWSVLFSNRTGTSFDGGKARGKDLTLLPVPNLPLCHWSSKLLDLRGPSSTDVPVRLLNRPKSQGRQGPTPGVGFSELSVKRVFFVYFVCLA